MFLPNVHQSVQRPLYYNAVVARFVENEAGISWKAITWRIFIIVFNLAAWVIGEGIDIRQNGEHIISGCSPTDGSGYTLDYCFQSGIVDSCLGGSLRLSPTTNSYFWLYILIFVLALITAMALLLAMLRALRRKNLIMNFLKFAVFFRNRRRKWGTFGVLFFFGFWYYFAKIYGFAIGADNIGQLDCSGQIIYVTYYDPFTWLSVWREVFLALCAFLGKQDCVHAANHY